MNWSPITKRLAPLMVFLASGVAAAGQSPGTFTPSGNLNQERIGHTATLLQDGRVLVVGGQSSDANLASAELYDPSTGTSSPTGSLIAGRSNHAAVRLGDGRVLIAGGYRASCQGLGCVAGDGSAEVYDPSTGQFRATGKMVAAQANQAAVLLASGKVLLAGGNLAQAGPAAVAPAELYDPGSGTFQALDWSAGFGATATLLPDGRVLIAGGYLARESWIYDPASAVLTPAGSLRTYSDGVYWHAATLLRNGNVLITGGADDGDGVNTLDNAELYDPLKGFTGIGSMLSARSLHTSTLLPDGTVLLAGGGNPVAEIYHPATGAFVATGRMTVPRSGHTATPLADGRVWIAGQDSSELYTPNIRAVSAASFSGPLAPGSLATLLGSGLSLTTAAAADLRSLPTTLGGISVRVRSRSGQARLAPLLYVSPAQINFLVPPDSEVGDAGIEVIGAPSADPELTVAVRAVAPGLFTLPNRNAAAYAVRVESDGTETLLEAGAIVLDQRPVYLVVYGTGIRGRSALDQTRATIGGISVPVAYAGPAGGGVPGLDQVNILLPAALKGNTDGRLRLTVDGVVSNTALVDVR